MSMLDRSCLSSSFGMFMNYASGRLNTLDRIEFISDRRFVSVSSPGDDSRVTSRSVRSPFNLTNDRSSKAADFFGALHPRLALQRRLFRFPSARNAPGSTAVACRRPGPTILILQHAGGC